MRQKKRVSKMIKTIYRLYHWCGGFNDCHQFEREFNNLEELIEYHKKYKPNSPLYNYSDIGNDYYEELQIVENEKKVVYEPNKNLTKGLKQQNDPIVEFLELTWKRLNESLNEG